MAVEEEEAPCHFNTLFEKNVPHVLERIFLSLDHESFVSCCEVNKMMNTFLTSELMNKKAKSLFKTEILADEKQLWRNSKK